jgi:hypothetical protein
MSSTKPSHTKSILESALRLGQKVRVGRKEAHLFGGTSESPWIGVGKRCGRKCPRTAFVALGEFSRESVGCWDRGDQPEDGLEDCHRVAGTIKASARDDRDFSIEEQAVKEG